MDWTLNPPTEPGYYWCRSTDLKKLKQEGSFIVYLLNTGSNRELQVRLHNNQGCPLSAITEHEWGSKLICPE